MARSVPSRLLVIDACVLRSAGKSNHPFSSSCRKFLMGVLEICHRVAVSEELLTEWKMYQSPFSIKWRGSMARLGKPEILISRVNTDLDIRCFTPAHRKAIRKDLHLIETAFAADHVVVTRDDRLRVALGSTEQGRALLGEICWLNPVSDNIALLAQQHESG